MGSDRLVEQKNQDIEKETKKDCCIKLGAQSFFFIAVRGLNDAVSSILQVRQIYLNEGILEVGM